MSKKKIKVKVKKRKLNIKRIIIVLVLFIIVIFIIYYFVKLPIRNIYITGNNMLSDKEIIDIIGIGDYPSMLSISSNKLENILKRNQYINNVKIRKKLNGKIYIDIDEKRILCSYDGKILLEDGNFIENNYDINSYPILLSDISAVKDKFITSFDIINDEILLKISEIEYMPNDVDSERFILKMNDGNVVYVTLSKTEKMNKYNSIYSSLDGKKGIIYLDSGDYVEVRE